MKALIALSLAFISAATSPKKLPTAEKRHFLIKSATAASLATFPNRNKDVSINLLAECYTREGYIAAINEKYLDDVIKYSIDKDYIAINKLLQAGVIVQMKKGIKVYLVEVHIFAGTVEFRIPGYTDTLWTVREGLKC